MVPRAGIEPAPCCHDRILSPARLPIPPPRHNNGAKIVSKKCKIVNPLRDTRQSCYTFAMTITSHTAVGTIIGLSVGNPILGFIIGFISHYLLDIIPHGDGKISDQLRVYKKKKGPITYGSIDAIIAIFVLLIILNISPATHNQVFSAAVAGSILPDLLTGLYDLTKWRMLKGFYKIHFFFHDLVIKRWRDINLTYSLILQVIFVACVLVYL